MEHLLLIISTCYSQYFPAMTFWLTSSYTWAKTVYYSSHIKVKAKRVSVDLELRKLFLVDF